MYRDRINKQKKMLGLSNKTLSERSKLHLPEETISRFLAGKTDESRMSTFLDICDSAELNPYEAFMDEATAAAFKLFLETKLSDIDNAGELKELREKTVKQEAEIQRLNERLEHKDEIIRLHERYNSIISGITK